MSTRNWTLGAIAALIAVPIGIAVAPLMAPGQLPGMAKTAEQIRGLAGVDLLKMLGARSPGARAVGELADTKAAKVKPHQRALAKVREPKPLPDTFVKPLFGEAPVEAPAPDAVPAQLAEATPPTPVITTPSPTLSVDVPPGGGGSGGTPVPPGGGGGGDTPVPPAVPEPATWAMMLVGFGAVGAAIRRRRRATDKAVVAQ